MREFTDEMRAAVAARQRLATPAQLHRMHVRNREATDFGHARPGSVILVCLDPLLTDEEYAEAIAEAKASEWYGKASAEGAAKEQRRAATLRFLRLQM